MFRRNGSLSHSFSMFTPSSLVAPSPDTETSLASLNTYKVVMMMKMMIMMITSTQPPLFTSCNSIAEENKESWG